MAANELKLENFKQGFELDIRESADLKSWNEENWKNFFLTWEEDRPIRFIVKGLGQVLSMMEKNDEVPLVLYDDGKACKAIQRKDWEVEAIGYVFDNTKYRRIAFGNFFHEAVHLFLSHKCDLTEGSVGYRQACGQSFPTGSTNMLEAVDEELIVIGFQLFLMNFTTQTIKGFQYFLAQGCMRYALDWLQSVAGFDLAELRHEFMQTLIDSNETFRLDT